MDIIIIILMGGLQVYTCNKEQRKVELIEWVVSIKNEHYQYKQFQARLKKMCKVKYLCCVFVLWRDM